MQVDDKFPPIGTTSLKKKNNFSPVGALGGGVEYFIANNLAVGLEAKYLFHQAALGVNGQDNHTNLNGLLWGGSLRVYFSEDSAGAPPMPSLMARDRQRIYLADRTGTSIPTHRSISPEGSLSGTQGLHFASGSLGVNIGRYWGVELAVDSLEQNIAYRLTVASASIHIHPLCPNFASCIRSLETGWFPKPNDEAFPQTSDQGET